jgi:hypothetical protein
MKSSKWGKPRRDFIELDYSYAFPNYPITYQTIISLISIKSASGDLLKDLARESVKIRPKPEFLFIDSNT